MESPGFNAREVLASCDPSMSEDPGRSSRHLSDLKDLPIGGATLRLIYPGHSRVPAISARRPASLFIGGNMNAFLSLLRSMVENLPEQTPSARATVYSRARDRMVRHLEKTEPPLSGEQIEKQVVKMRDAIVLIEQDYAGNGYPAESRKKPIP
jgi:hypothetical protein